MRVTDSTLSGNSAIDTAGSGFGSGGGIYNLFGPLTVTDSILSGNSASYNGGGIRNNEGRVMVNGSSTLSGNSAGATGGGIANDFGGTLTVGGSTLSSNSASDGGGIVQRSGKHGRSPAAPSGNTAGSAAASTTVRQARDGHRQHLPE